jgi:hypothetical protein
MSPPERTRFFILARGRTGSTLLHQLLDSHPQCICFEEIFADRPLPEEFPADYPAAKLQGMQRDEALRKSDPLAFLDRYVFAPDLPESVRSVGFKLFYFHSNAGRSELWDHLKQDTSVRVVHLRRRNLLRMFLSMKIAFKTGAWWSLSGMPGLDERAIALDAGEFRTYVDQSLRQRDAAEAAFASHPIFPLWYEEFENYPQDPSRIDELLDFLDLPARRLHSEMRRQNPEPLRQLIVNYDALKAEFAGTPLAAYFDED